MHFFIHIRIKRSSDVGHAAGVSSDGRLNGQREWWIKSYSDDPDTKEGPLNHFVECVH